MKIGNQVWMQSVHTVKRTSYVSKAGAFQDALAAQTAQLKSDSVTISDPNVFQESRKTANAPNLTDSNAILPTDSTEAKLEKLRRIAETADYAGMDYEDIYCTIWGRYQQAFNGEMSAITSCLIGGKDWADINNQFVNEVNKTVFFPLYQEIKDETGLSKGTPEFNEYWKEHYDHKFSSSALGYGEMSVEEKEQAIRDKYAGRNSLYDFASMMGELSGAGILSHQMGDRASFSYMNMIHRELVNTCFPDSYNGCPADKDWARIMYQPFDAWGFALEMREPLKNMRFENWDFDIQNTLAKGFDNLFKTVFY